MKKILLPTLFAFFLINSFAQETEENKAQFYLATGISVSNTGFNDLASSSFGSIEVGLMKNIFGFALVGGRSNFSDFDHDDISNYWVEAKSSVSFPLGKANGYGLLGFGNYLNTSQFFIEYGVGYSYSWDHWGVFGQVSNWDNAWYVTPGVSYTF